MSTQVFSFPQTSIPTGTFAIPQTLLPALTASVTLSLAKCTTATPTIWPNLATKLNMALEVSYDGGTSWVGGGGITGASGGVEHGKSGAEIANAQFSFTYPSSPTHIRGTLTVSGGPLLTSGSVSVN